MRTLAVAAAVLASASTAGAGVGRTPSDCAIAWNRSAGAQLHAAVKRSGAVAAYIDARAAVGRDTWSKKGGSTSTTSPGCAIWFLLPGGWGLATSGAWVGSGVPHWASLVSANHRVSFPRNARVRADGTVGFHG